VLVWRGVAWGRFVCHVCRGVAWGRLGRFVCRNQRIPDFMADSKSRDVFPNITALLQYYLCRGVGLLPYFIYGLF